MFEGRKIIAVSPPLAQRTRKRSFVLGVMRAALIALTGLLALCGTGGCSGSSAAFMGVGDADYPSKPSDFDVAVFDAGETPEREFDVIGIVYTSSENPYSSLDRTAIIKLLTREAGKHGADAIMDIQIVEASAYDTQTRELAGQEHQSAQAKAIVFK